MPIEFRCSQCGKMLRVPDTATGKRAKCPDCEAVMEVPASTPAAEPTPDAAGPAPSGETPQVNPFASPPGQTPAGSSPETNPFADAAGAGAAGATGQETFNPYQSPAGFKTDQAPKWAAGKELRRTPVDFGQVLGKTWEVFTAQVGQCVLFALVVIGIQIAAQIVTQPLGLIQRAFGDEIAAVVFIGVLQQVWGLVVQAFMMCVTVPFALNLARGSRAPFDGIFSMGPYFLAVLGQQFLLALIAVGILVVCMLPLGIAALTGEPMIMFAAGIAGGCVAVVVLVVVTMMFFLAPYFIIDRRQGVIEGMKSSKEYMQGNKGTVFLLMLVVGILGGMFVVFTCCIGALFYIPYFTALGGIIYLSATGQLTSGGVV